MCKVEALLKLQRLDEAQTILASSPNMELLPASFLKIRFFDMISQAYIYFVKSQIELALGRLDIDGILVYYYVNELKKKYNKQMPKLL